MNYDDETAEMLDQLLEDWEVAMEKGELAKALFIEFQLNGFSIFGKSMTYPPMQFKRRKT